MSDLLPQPEPLQLAEDLPLAGDDTLTLERRPLIDISNITATLRSWWNRLMDLVVKVLDKASSAAAPRNPTPNDILDRLRRGETDTPHWDKTVKVWEDKHGSINIQATRDIRISTNARMSPQDLDRGHHLQDYREQQRFYRRNDPTEIAEEPSSIFRDFERQKQERIDRIMKRQEEIVQQAAKRFTNKTDRLERSLSRMEDQLERNIERYITKNELYKHK
jgi:hypothetical protein